MALTSRAARVVIICALLAGCSNGGAEETDATPETPATTSTAPWGGGAQGDLPVTSRELIDRALADGDIDEPTSLLYRAWAQFNDAQLPPEFRGAARGHDEALSREVREKLDSLPAEVRAELEPYLLRPTDPHSVFSIGTPAGPAKQSGAADPASDVRRGGGQAGVTARTAALIGASTADPGPDDPRACTDGWSSMSDDTLPFRVWVCTSRWSDGGLNAQRDVLAALDTYLPTMTQPPPAGMGEPLPDDRARDEHPGSDEKVDIYFVDDRWFQANISGAAIATAEYPGERSSGYILIKRSQAKNRDELTRTVVHEVFHVLQYAHTVEVKDRWWMEGTATWAASHYARELSAPLHAMWAPNLQDSTLSLMAAVPDGHNYAAYLWPLFMELVSGPQAIFTVWRTVGDEAPESDVHKLLLATISSQVDIAARFPDFALRLLNADLPGNPIGRGFADLDPNFSDHQPDLDEALVGEDGVTIRFPGTPGLGYRFVRLRVDSPPDAAVGVHVSATDDLTQGGQPTIDALVRDERGRYTRTRIDLGPDGTDLCVNGSFMMALSNVSTDPEDEAGGGVVVERRENPACALAGDLMLTLTGEYHSPTHAMPYTEHASVHWSGSLEIGLGEQRVDSAFGERYFENTGSRWTMRGSYRHERCAAFDPDHCVGRFVEQTFAADADLVGSGVPSTGDDGNRRDDDGWLRLVVDGDEVELRAELPITVTTVIRNPTRPTQRRTEQIRWALECASDSGWSNPYPTHDEFVPPDGEPLGGRWIDDSHTVAEFDCKERWATPGGYPDETGMTTFTAQGRVAID